MSENEQETPKFKVTDRRSFTSDGERRDDPESDRRDGHDRSAVEASSPQATAPPRQSEPSSVGELVAPSGRGERERESAPSKTERPPDVDPTGQHPKPQFLDLVSMLATQVMVHLGDMSHPDGGTSKEDLQSAQLMIDFLELLSEKTKGNLDGQEEKVMSDVLYDLRMRFLAKAKVINL